jgi:dCMP deaminase
MSAGVARAATNMRPSRDEWALGLAMVTARRSTCKRREVGCVLLNARGHVMGTGYNGVAAGQPHCNDTWRPYQACPAASAPSGTGLDGCQAIHAEQNALLQCRDPWSIDTCYVTASPCVTCIKLLLNTSCKRIVFLEEYPHGEARKWWEAAGREWKKFSDASA